MKGPLECRRPNKRPLQCGSLPLPLALPLELELELPLELPLALPQALELPLAGAEGGDGGYRGAGGAGGCAQRDADARSACWDGRVGGAARAARVIMWAAARVNMRRVPATVPTGLGCSCTWTP